MASTPEAKVKDKIKGKLARYGAYYTMPVMTGMASNGTPDIIACCACQFLGIEAKAGKGKPTDLQLVRLKAIRDAGGIALVINESNLDVLDAVLVHLTSGQYTAARALSNLDQWL